ncbi:hypothetical protein [Pseudaestuariivita atlantica]|uniref:Uncharacterized protein n=1 Tax=Pseudaestuariivita atlantica TaxID=1317121 RepID=A0A0L1JM83_9RHOB|nr:hypothetical protein [Pseudaestuariivita atlantica]KNG92866.1 hypothetical protein ATO11_15505 [Pseudaestuariivita atlantica]
MKKLTIAAIVASAGFAAPALAWEGKVIACYDKVWVPAKYSTTHVPHQAAKTKWVYQNGQMVEIYYPAIMKEMKTLVKEGYYIKRKAPCRNGN